MLVNDMCKEKKNNKKNSYSTCTINFKKIHK